MAAVFARTPRLRQEAGRRLRTADLPVGVWAGLTQEVDQEVTLAGAKRVTGKRVTGKRAFEGRRKSCYFCKEKIVEVDWKNISQLRRYLSERGKIRGRGNTGACRKHQRQVAVAIKRAREMALLPYVGESAPPAARSRSRD